MVHSKVNVRDGTSVPGASQPKLRKNNQSNKTGKMIYRNAKPTKPVDSSRLHSALLRHKLNKSGVSEEQKASTTAYTGWQNTFGMNPQAAKKELVLDIIDFFDYSGETTQAVRQYKYNPNSYNLLPVIPGALGGPTGNVGKVVSVKVWALPEFEATTVNGAGPANATVQILFGVPVNSWQFVNDIVPPATTPTQDGYAGTAGQTATTLTPTSVSDWVVVGEYQADQIFGDANFGPVYDDFGNQALFTYSVVNPDDATQSSTPLQMCVEIVCAQTLPVLGEIKAGQVASQNEDAWSNATEQDVPDDQPAMVSLRKLTNSI